MERRESELGREKRIDAEAADWVAKKFCGLTASEQDSFFDWLALSPAHSEAFVKHQELWKRMDALAEWAPEHSEFPLKDLLERRKGASSWYGLGGLAASLLFAFLIWFSGAFDSGVQERQHYVARSYERHSFPDGSVVDMKSGAAMFVDYTSSERRIELVAGEALFTVAKDENRPLVVSAKGVEVRAIGTAFVVGVSEQELKVVVTEGKVSVGPPAPRDEGPNLPVRTLPGDVRLPTLVEELVAGQRSTIFLETPVPQVVVEQAVEEEVLKDLDWKYRLDFDATPLSQAVRLMNQRGAAEFVIVDEEIASLPLVATVRLNKIASIAEVLEFSLGIKAEVDPRGRILLSKGSASL